MLIIIPEINGLTLSVRDNKCNVYHHRHDDFEIVENIRRQSIQHGAYQQRPNKYPALPVPLWFFNPFKYNTSCEWGVRMVNEY